MLCGMFLTQAMGVVVWPRVQEHVGSQFEVVRDTLSQVEPVKVAPGQSRKFSIKPQQTRTSGIKPVGGTKLDVRSRPLPNRLVQNDDTQQALLGELFGS